MRLFLLALGAGLALAGSAPAQQAQDDLLMRFETQLKQDRGLSLSEVGSTGSVSAGAAGAAAATEGAANLRRAPSSEIELAPEEANYRPMPKEAEVNLQIRFALDSDVIEDSELGKLEAVCKAVQTLAGAKFRIFGHTDASGSDIYNLLLSRRRAEAVRLHLVETCGVAPDRLEAFGVGEAHPLTQGRPRAPENRRVEFQALG